MATGGCVSVSPLSTPYSASRSAFSIRNILNLPEDNKEEHQKFPSGSKEAAYTCFSSSHPLIPRVARAHFLYSPIGYSDFKISLSGGLPNLQPGAQMNQFPFPSPGSSFGEELLKKRRRLPLRKKKQRPLFSTNQIQTMENEFTKCQYVSESRRAELAVDLNLTETQVKTWFQNRRTKRKKESRSKGEPPSRRVQSYHEGAIRHAVPEGDLIYNNERYHLYPIVWNIPNLCNFPSQKSLFSW